jgi:lipopolysaccharide export system protein LptA
MNKLILVLIVSLSLGLAGTASAATAKIRLSDRSVDLSCKTIDISDKLYALEGSARLVTTYTSETVKPGTIRLDSIDADRIEVEMAKDAKGNQSPAKATATGGVEIRAKRAEKKSDSSAVTVQDIYATGKQATLLQAQDTVVLTGSVVIKITEAGSAAPVAVISGNKITFSLKDNRIRVEG